MNALKVLSKRMLSWLIARAGATIKDKSGKEHEVTKPISLGMASLQESGDPEDLIEIVKGEVDSLLEINLSGGQLELVSKNLTNHIKKEPQKVLNEFLSGFENGGSEDKAIGRFKAYIRNYAKGKGKFQGKSLNESVGDDGKTTREESVADKSHNTEKHVEDKAGASEAVKPVKQMIVSLDKLLRSPIADIKGFDSLEFIMKVGGSSKEAWEKGMQDIQEDATKCDVDHLDACRNVMTDSAKIIPFLRNIIKFNESEKESPDDKKERSKRPGEFRGGGKQGVFFQSVAPFMEEGFTDSVDAYFQLTRSEGALRGAQNNLKAAQQAGNPDDIKRKQTLVDKHQATVQELLQKHGGREKLVEKNKQASTLWHSAKGRMEKLSKQCKELTEAIMKLQQVARAAYRLGMALRKQGMLSKRCLTL